MIARLEPIFRGDWAPYSESLACTPCPPADALRVADLLGDATLLAGLLRRHALHLGCSDLRPVASAWSLHYLWALLPPIVAGASLLGHAFPVRPEEMHVQFDADGEALRFHVSDEGCPRPDADTAARYDALLWQHLDPLFTALSRLARVAPKILWGNAARYLGSIFEQGLALSGRAPCIVRDHDQLLERPTWPDGRINPLHTPRRQALDSGEGGHVTPVTLHRQCCLYYLLPGEGYCVACPLSPRYRKLKGAAPAV